MTTVKEETLQDIGRNQAAVLVEMVAALDVDYDRLEKLRGARDTLREEFDAMPANAGVDFMNWSRNQDLMTSEDVDALIALERVTGECTSLDDAAQRISEDALSVQVRSGWYSPSAVQLRPEPEEYEILLSTGGPATRIIGTLSGLEPDTARLEVQDWGTPWTQYHDIDEEVLLTYARSFYFGE